MRVWGFGVWGRLGLRGEDFRVGIWGLGSSELG